MQVSQLNINVFVDRSRQCLVVCGWLQAGFVIIADKTSPGLQNWMYAALGIKCKQM